ncbi:MAG TPA: dTDP-4-dehydrorhamnose reductase [Kiloniellaceae bacterium]|nr:dTDP-4-dehydrorhamnose reductase [Kiloniellaceae bacterium]
MTLLLLGAEGQVGREVAALAAARGLPITALARRDLDITDRAAVRQAVDAGASTVVNCAAYTAVDRAESEEARAMAVNRDGAGFVAEACEAAGAALIHLSTDYVFDGRKGSPYREDDAVAPLNVYGRSKLAGEEAVRAACPAHAILRTSWVFGAEGANFVKTMLRLGAERDELRVVADQFGCPTPAAALAERILAVAERIAPESYGTWHCAGAERTSWFDFAVAIFAAQREINGQPRPKLTPIATADYPTAARRPVDSTLDSTRFQATFATGAIDWRAGLKDVLHRLAVR